MKRKLFGLLVALLVVVVSGCDNPLTEAESSDTDSENKSRLVIVNGTDVVMLSVYMRTTGTTSWGSNLLDQYTETGNLPAGGTCVIEDIEYGTYDMHAYCYGNYYRYNVTFDTVEGKEWGFY